EERSGNGVAASARDNEGGNPRISRLNRFSLARTDGPGGSGPSCRNHGCVGGERCGGGGPGGSRSTQRHWLKYSFTISLRLPNQARYLRVVSGSIVCVDQRRNLKSHLLRRSAVVTTFAGCDRGFLQGDAPSWPEYLGVDTADALQFDPEIETEISRNRRRFTLPKMTIHGQVNQPWLVTREMACWHNLCSGHKTTVATRSASVPKHDDEKENELCLNHSYKMSGLVFVFCSRKSRSVF